MYKKKTTQTRRRLFLSRMDEGGPTQYLRENNAGAQVSSRGEESRHTFYILCFTRIRKQKTAYMAFFVYLDN